MEEIIAQKIMRQIRDCMKFMYEKNIAHRDLKHANILLEFPGFWEREAKGEEFPQMVKEADLLKIDFLVKIADFGISRQYESLMDTRAGTALFQHPGIFENE